MTYIGALWYMKLVSVTTRCGGTFWAPVSPDWRCDEGSSRRRRAYSMLRQLSPILDPIARATTWFHESVNCHGLSIRVEALESER